MTASNEILENSLAQFQQHPTDQIKLPEDCDILGVYEQARIQVVSTLQYGNVERAELLVNWCKTFAEQAHSVEYQACADWAAGLFYLPTSPQLAIHSFERAAHFFATHHRPMEEARVMIGGAYIYSLLGQYEKSQQTLLHIVKVMQAMPDYRDWPMIYLNLSFNAQYLGQYESMMNWARLAEQNARQLQQPLRLTQALINQAWAARCLLDFSLCAEKLMEADSLPEIPPELKGHISIIRLKMLIYQNNLLAVLRESQRAYQYFTAANNQIDLATTAIEEAGLLHRLHLPNEARKKYEFAAQQFYSLGIAGECVEAWLGAIRIATWDEGSVRQLTAYLESAKKVMDIVPNKQKNLLRVYTNHGLLTSSTTTRKIKLAENDQSIQLLEQSLDFDEALEARLVNAELACYIDKKDGLQRAYALIERAKQLGNSAIEQAALKIVARMASPKAALFALTKVTELMDLQHQTMPIEELKATLLSGFMPIYARRIALELRLGKQKQALNTLLITQGSLWQSLFSREQYAATETMINHPDWIRAKETVDFLQRELLDKPSVEATQVLRQHLEKARGQVKSIARQFAAQNTMHTSQHQRQHPAIDLALIQADLQPHDVALNYIVCDDQLWVCVISPLDNPVWLALGKAKMVQEAFDQLMLRLGGLQRSSPAQRVTGAEAQSATIAKLIDQLCAQLLLPLAPYLQARQRILLVPDETLFSISWAALLRAYAAKSRLEKLPELLILPALTLCSIRSTPTTSGEAIVLGHMGSPPLQHIHQEIQQICQILSNPILKFPAKLSDTRWEVAPRILHIATHGKLDAKSPLLSWLQLSDGDLLLAEIMQVNLQGTQLVTLSACETAAMPERGGVALALAGAFLIAGAQAVLASLWQVDDESTHRLMMHFYCGLMAGQTASVSLQHAQSALIAEGFKHPFYWAGFQLIHRTLT